MQVFEEGDVRAALPWERLIEELRSAFGSGCQQPLRTVHSVKVPGEPDATFLMMPAWNEGGKLAVKILFIVPGNGRRNLPAVNATVMVFDAVKGAPEAVLEGGELTARRTVATSALAADAMARRNARTLLVIGAGTIASNLVPAHRAIRDYDRVWIWARDADKGAALAARFDAAVSAVTDLDAAVPDADVISAGTLANEPLIKGALLKPGTHLDLVGGFLPTMREADSDAIRRAAGAIVVDTWDGVLAEAGDIIQPIKEGAITRQDIAGDLAALCKGEIKGRNDDAKITVFKSVGAAIEDFAAARLAVASNQTGRQ
ncbi:MULTISPECIES: ornithine cyclodeaminase family protein [unclassified Roseitalea]|uniref:ornithine cyclodeaminase family protein n=1 Tax=unclassified Roseitalea TaxID=2639107 RepID=UPI00273D2C61|nr:MULTISPECIES: ornithine cyclodeaminase family protein [unclassified Roseitalea]